MPKHLALVIVNLRPGMDGGSSAMLELLHYVSRLGYRASLFAFLTNEPQLRDLFAERIALKGLGLSICQDDTYRYREGEVDCQVRFLPYTVDELRADRAPFLKAITKTIRNLPVHYVLTADRIAVFAAHILGMPGCHFFHSLGNIQRMQHMPTMYRRSLLIRETVTVSSFLRGKVKDLLGLDATVLSPPIDFRSYTGPRDKEAAAIGFYAGGHVGYKGDEIVNAIIKKMPDKKFLIVGKSYRHEFGELPANVTYCGFQSDMQEFYRQVKVMLVPSLAPEGFSRIILEAAANGIPVIANNIGGIPEALGDSGVLIDIESHQPPDIQQIADCYVTELRKLYHNANAYETASNKARLRVKQYLIDLEGPLRLFLQNHVP